MNKSNLTPERFLEEYSRYFGIARTEGIQALGYLMIERYGEGPYIYDTHGDRFLDLWCMGGLYNLGHRNPKVMRATKQAIEDWDFGSCFFFSEPKAKLAKFMAENTPGDLEVTMMLATGSEAVDNAIKLARGATGKTDVIYADYEYHGTTGFSLSMMAKGSSMREYAEPLMPNFHEVKYGDIDSLRAAINEKTAAVVLEPLRTDFDGKSPDAAYFPAVRELCDKHGAKLIIDEVVTGLGRLGKLWGCELWGVVPDMLVTAKGFSVGIYPNSAVVMKQEVLDFWRDDPFRNLSSFSVSNIGAIAAMAGIQETIRLLPEANKMGDRLAKIVDDLAKRFPSVLKSVRRTGLLWALDFADEGKGLEFLAGMFERGVIVVASSQNLAIPKIYPPLILEDEQISEFAEKAEDTLKSIR